jgi:hypothetical protein
MGEMTAGSDGGIPYRMAFAGGWIDQGRWQGQRYGLYSPARFILNEPSGRWQGQRYGLYSLVSFLLNKPSGRCEAQRYGLYSLVSFLLNKPFVRIGA